VIWLGEADETSDEVMDYLRYDAQVDDNWTPCVMDLFCRPWWSRVWVVQEAASARRDPIFRCGDQELSWSRLRPLQNKVPFTGCLHYVVEVQRWRYESQDPDDAIVKVHAVIHMRMFFDVVDRLRSGIALLWRDAFALGHIMSSTDPLDRIYALMGLFEHQTALSLEPDYDRDSASVHREAAFLNLQRSESLQPLTITSSFSREHLPIWVPDLTNGEPGILMTTDTSIYKAAQGTVAQLRWSDDHKIFHAFGMVCDTIVDVVHGWNNKTKADGRAFRRARHLAYRFGERNGLDTAITKERFWRTMIMNQGWPRFGSTFADLVCPAPPDLGHRYMAWQNEVEVPHLHDSVSVSRVLWLEISFVFLLVDA
jgi:hypothetical protein